MESLNMTKNKIFFTMIGLIIAGLVYLLAPILTPFLAGALLAYLFNPIVEKLTRLHLPRILSVLIVFVGIFSLFLLMLLLVVPLIQKQIVLLINFIPTVILWIQNTFLPEMREKLGVSQVIDTDTLKTTLAGGLSKAGNVATWLLQAIMHSGMTLALWITNLILIPVVTFYLLRDWNGIIKNIRKLIPRRIEPVAVKLVKECDATIAAFFRGQLMVMLSLGVIYASGLMMIHLELGLIIGLIAGLLCIIPYLGFIVGIIAAIIAALVQFGTMESVMLVCVVFAIGQMIESFFLTPHLVGDRIGLHPVAVIFALMAGGSLFGFFGVLLALPAAAVIMVLLHFLNQHYKTSQYYQ
jgi:predicted PurR-regulated permease PerM